MAVEVKVPEVGESITEVTLAQWLKKDGEYVHPDELICEIESDKASFEIPAESGGILHHKVEEGATLPIGAVLAEIEEAEAPAEVSEAAPAVSTADVAEAAPAVESPPLPAEEKPVSTDHGVKITPVAANILTEAGISPETVRGSGPGGRITKEDALKAVAAKEETREAGVTTPPPKPTAPPPPKAAPTMPQPPSEERSERRERMSTLRKTIAKRLVAAKNETAMLTTFNEIDMSEVIKLRKKYKEKFQERYEIGLGFMSFFTRAVCIALREFPPVNASIDEDFIVYHDFCDISIAVSTPRGLVVPVIRNADRMSLWEIEKAVAILAQKARDNQLTIEEMTGGTFTITNGGVFGSLMSTPILNAPQSAILGMHKIQERPVVIDGEIVVRPMMYVALSYDHRIIDGRESVSFLVRVKELLEDPARMLLEI